MKTAVFTFFAVLAAVFLLAGSLTENLLCCLGAVPPLVAAWLALEGEFTENQ